MTFMMNQWPLESKINVVLFAGLGGACQGMEEAGWPVHIAVNHDEIAIAAHRELNPHTRHLQADIHEVDPLEATGGRYVGNLWASPDCRDHSVAKGGAPRSPRVRSMPWQVCRWVGRLRKRGLGPDTVYLENVREIRGWGPLVAKRDKATGRVLKLDGTVAAKGERVPVRQQQLVRNPKEAGRHYRAWKRHMAGLGAIYVDRDLCCGDFKVPTSRKRLFGVARFDGRQPEWPIQTNAHRKSEAARSGRLLPHVMAATIIDWSVDMASIFDRDKPLALATQKRIAIGVKRFVIEAEKPFLIYLTHQGNRPPIDLDDSFPTLTGAHRGEVAVVGPALVPTTHSKSPPRIHDGRDSTPTLTAGVKGGELAVMAAHLTRYHGEKRPGETRVAELDDGLPTQTVENRFGVIGAHLVQTGYGERPGQQPRCMSAEDAIGTQVTNGGKHAIVAAHLTKFQQNSFGQCPEDAIDTLMAGAARFGVVAAHLHENRTRSIGHDLHDGIPTQTQRSHHDVVGAWVVQHNNDGRGNIHQGRSLEDSLGVLTTTGSQQQVAAATLIHQRGTGTATSPEDAIRTLATGGGKGGDHVGITAAFLHHQYSCGGQHSDLQDAVPTVSTVDRAMVTGADGIVPPLTPAQLVRARQVAEFLRAHGVWDGGDIVTFGCWIIADLCMRMLKHWEAAAAHELRMPEQITVRKKDRKGKPMVDVLGNPVFVRRPLTKTEAMRLIGNSVPKRMAKLLLQANAQPTLAIQAAE